MVKNGNMKKQKKKDSFWTFKKLTYKQRRILYGITMFYSFLALAHMIYIIVKIGSLLVFFGLLLWFFPPVALILLTYHLLVNVYPPEEKDAGIK